MASVVGTSHSEIGALCQDAIRSSIMQVATGEEVLVVVIADGAGSASHAADGAALTCALFIDEAEALFESEGAIADLTRDFIKAWVARLHRELNERAAAKALTLRDFACTFLAAVVGEKCAVFVQIGDGAIVINDTLKGNYHCVFWPQGGEYAGTTNFVTDPSFDRVLEHVFVDRHILELSLLTDGIQPFALRLNDREAHTPFFKPIFAAMQADPPGYNETFSQSLADFLNSERVNERTADDKTMLLASRGTAQNPMMEISATEKSAEEDSAVPE